MLGTVLWNTGALGSVAAYNVITWTPTLGSLSSSFVYGRALGATPAHTPDVLGASQLIGFLGDFYFRIHITTLRLDLGNLVSDQTQNVTLWNAWRRAWILTDLDVLNGDGITVTGQPDPPLQYAPLQERIYTISVSVDGPAIIDSEISWEFSSGETITMEVVGVRVIPWNWAPDWSAGMLERLQWYTDVIEAARGEEQRRSLRIDPRQSLEFSVTISGADRRIMETTLWNWGARVFAVPLWFDGQALAATLASGSTVIPLNPATRGYVVGELVTLTSGNPSVFEVVEIASLGATITLARPTLQTWPAGTKVYPSRPAIIENEASASRFTGNDSTLRLQWRMLDPMTWGAAATPTYRSLPVFEHKPNWTDDPELQFERKLSVLDAGTGLTLIEDQADMPLTTQRMRYTLPDKAGIDTWKKRLWALRGRQGSIWVPTWASDFTVVTLIGSGALTIDVAWSGYTKYLLNEPNRRDLRIQIANGSIFYRRITGAVEVSPTVERLSIDVALGVTVQIVDVALVSFMGLSRSDSDSHELSYFTGDTADTAFSARGFRNEL